jgi:uncharacterized membrane protein
MTDKETNTMKHAKIIAPALMATLALSAVVVSAAQAAEYGKCESVKATGGYTNESCTTSSGTHKGNFEWVPITAGAHISYTSVSDKEMVLSLENLGLDFRCKTSTSVGVITGTKTAQETITYKSCWDNAGDMLTSKGQPSNTIKTNVLATTLIGQGEKGLGESEPEKGVVFTQVVSAEHEPYLAEFRVGSGPVIAQLRGWLDPRTTPVNNRKTSSSRTESVMEKGLEAALNEKFEEPGKEFEPISTTSAVSTTYSTAIEIRG